MSYSTKNYSEQGGDKWVIGGELEVREGAVIKGLSAAPTPVAANQPDSTAEEMEALVSDFNALIQKLKAAGLMAAD